MLRKWVMFWKLRLQTRRLKMPKYCK
jgi:hypothetical protein